MIFFLRFKLLPLTLAMFSSKVMIKNGRCNVLNIKLYNTIVVSLLIYRRDG